MIRRSIIHALPRNGAAASEDAALGPLASGGVTRVAIADGATESAHAGRWARALVDAACSAPLAESVERARESFAAGSEQGGPPLAWYAEAKREEGAFATLLALALWPDGTWRAESVGDCVLFHLRDEALLASWPIDDHSAFGNRPRLIASRADLPMPPAEAVEGEWRSGDAFLLASDALAAYLLEKDPLAARNLDASGFAALVRRGREQGMRNDDVTLIEIELR